MVPMPARVSASPSEQGAEVILFIQRDLNNDGAPDMAVISANYMGDYFQVVVLDQGKDMQKSSEWQTGTDFVNDLWLFQTEAGDQTKLIIRFSHGSTGYTADLFDDVNKDGTVSYEIHAGNQVAITESQFPTVQFIAQQPWILSSGNVNYLVQIKGYRPLYNPITASYGEEILDFLPHDGRLAMEDEIVDNDADGIPDYELMAAHPDVPYYWTLFLTRMSVSIGKDQQPAFKDPFFWPYLGFADPQQWTFSNLIRGPEGLTPPVQVDWQTGRIKGIAEFLPMWGRGDRWDFFLKNPTG